MQKDEYVERVKALLIQIIESKIDLVIATRQLRELYDERVNSIIPITMGVFYESELDGYPIPKEYDLWSKAALKEQLKKVELYREDIVSDAKALLIQIEGQDRWLVKDLPIS